jgi:pimeloyl-ACP methyl ester carboxylesterase
MRVFKPALVLAALFVGSITGQPSRATEWHQPIQLNESMYVRIGGIDQWLQISGTNPSNPVLLWLNGGPGASTVSSICLYKSWERMFTIVMWDQRGEGKTFERSGESVAASMTINRMSDDGIEVAQYLRRHLHKREIILLGHSWGSILGIHMIVKRPDLFVAYVGTGQVVNLHRQFEEGYPKLLERAAINSQAQDELKKIGPPPWKNEHPYEIVNKWAAALDPPSKVNPQVCAGEKLISPPPYIHAGAQFSGRMLFDAIGQEDMNAFAKVFAVPVVFIQGSDDALTTTSVVKQYFEEIKAPHKDFVELPGTGHLAIFRDPDAFLAQLVAKVRPLAMRSHP